MEKQDSKDDGPQPPRALVEIQLTELTPHPGDDVELEAPHRDHSRNDGLPAGKTPHPGFLDKRLGVHAQSSIAGASSNFVNSIIGAGIVGLAFAVEEAGFVMGLVLLVFVAATTDYTVRLIVRLGLQERKLNYEDLCEHLLGRRGYFLVSISMLVFAFGAMLAYLIILGDTVPKVLEHATGSSGLHTDRHFIIICSAVFLILPLCLLRDMARLQFSSSLSVAAVVVIVMVVVIHAPASADDQGISAATSEDPYAFVRWGSVFAGIGAMSFAFVCHHSSFVVFQSLRRPNNARWSRVTHISIAVALLASMMMALGGYLAYFSHVKGDVLENFAADDTAANVARAALALTMVFTYPMEQFVARHSMDSMLFDARQPVSAKRHYGLTLCLWGLSLAIALVVEDLGVVLEISGSLSASVLGYILPIICYWKLYPPRSKWDEFVKLLRSPDSEVGTHRLTKGIDSSNAMQPQAIAKDGHPAVFVSRRPRCCKCSVCRAFCAFFFPAFVLVFGCMCLVFGTVTAVWR